jgi:hypothetical protein
MLVSGLGASHVVASRPQVCYHDRLICVLIFGGEKGKIQLSAPFTIAIHPQPTTAVVIHSGICSCGRRLGNVDTYRVKVGSPDVSKFVPFGPAPSSSRVGLRPTRPTRDIQSSSLPPTSPAFFHVFALTQAEQHRKYEHIMMAAIKLLYSHWCCTST